MFKILITKKNFLIKRRRSYLEITKTRQDDDREALIIIGDEAESSSDKEGISHFKRNVNNTNVFTRILLISVILLCFCLVERTGVHNT